MSHDVPCLGTRAGFPAAVACSKSLGGHVMLPLGLSGRPWRLAWLPLELLSPGQYWEKTGHHLLVIHGKLVWNIVIQTFFLYLTDRIFCLPLAPGGIAARAPRIRNIAIRIFYQPLLSVDCEFGGNNLLSVDCELGGNKHRDTIATVFVRMARASRSH
jgi:hypothetical protein